MRKSYGRGAKLIEVLQRFREEPNVDADVLHARKMLGDDPTGREGARTQLRVRPRGGEAPERIEAVEHRLRAQARLQPHRDRRSALAGADAKLKPDAVGLGRRHRQAVLAWIGSWRSHRCVHGCGHHLRPRGHRLHLRVLAPPPPCLVDKEKPEARERGISRDARPGWHSVLSHRRRPPDRSPRGAFLATRPLQASRGSLAEVGL
mmetsp:Transcript_42252/g.126426  ORF Transcript_42252/g.126426 Transcript_42252/m.126426 type:complete len:205 (+) Transcript_42252:278-892(+)